MCPDLRDTLHLQQIAAAASAVAADDALLRQLAWRLGIPEDKIRPNPDIAQQAPREDGTDPSEAGD